MKTYKNAHLIPSGGVTVDKTNSYKLKDGGREKNPDLKLISMIYSNNNTTDGQKLRHTLASKLPYYDGYGDGAGKAIANKSTGLTNYLFSVCIEKSQEDNQFSDHLLDAFATSTVPIYWGPSNIKDYFDVSGIIILDDPNNLREVIEKLNTTYW